MACQGYGLDGLAMGSSELPSYLRLVCHNRSPSQGLGKFAPVSLTLDWARAIVPAHPLSSEDDIFFFCFIFTGEIIMKRHEINLNILKALKTGQADPKLLAQYTGFGGLKEVIYLPEYYRQLKQVLSDDDIVSLKQTLSSAYYTPELMVQFIDDAIVQMGITPKRILEPAAGVGAFLKSSKIHHADEVVAVEMDNISSRLLKLIYPNIKVKHQLFEDFRGDVGQFDLIVGNPPYSSQKINDAQYPDLSGLVIHHYFVAKCMRLLAQGGILAMVLPCYFLDNIKHHARDIIANDGGQLLAAYRLPEDCFYNAKITVDIVFMTKGKSNLPEWRRSVYRKFDGGRQAINEYFIENPANVLGKMTIIDMYGRKGLACKRLYDPYPVLSEKLNQLPTLTTEKAANSFNIDCYIDKLNNRINQLIEKRQSLLQAKLTLHELQGIM